MDESISPTSFFRDDANLTNPLPIETFDTAFSPRVGIVIKPIEDISIYASYTESFNPTLGQSVSGDVFEPERGNQIEVGLKADMLDGRLSATLAYYQLRRTNVLPRIQPIRAFRCR